MKLRVAYHVGKSENYDIIVNIPIYGRLEAIWKPDSGHIVCESLSLLSYKN